MRSGLHIEVSDRKRVGVPFERDAIGFLRPRALQAEQKRNRDELQQTNHCELLRARRDSKQAPCRDAGRQKASRTDEQAPRQANRMRTAREKDGANRLTGIEA